MHFVDREDDAEEPQRSVYDKLEFAFLCRGCVGGHVLVFGIPPVVCSLRRVPFLPFFSCVSVNGEKQDGGFDDVEGEVFPCAGSYRSGVTIRLLKVGVIVLVAYSISGNGLSIDNVKIDILAWNPTIRVNGELLSSVIGG